MSEGKGGECGGEKHRRLLGKPAWQTADIGGRFLTITWETARTSWLLRGSCLDQPRNVASRWIPRLTGFPKRPSASSCFLQSPFDSSLAMGRSANHVIRIAIGSTDQCLPDETQAIPSLFFHFTPARSTEQLEAVIGNDGAKDQSNPNSIVFKFVPPLPEQRRIVGILDEAFAGIATAKANAEKNLQNARDLFESHLQAVFTPRGDGWANHEQLDDLTDPNRRSHTDVKPGGEGDVVFVRGGDLAAGGS